MTSRRGFLVHSAALAGISGILTGCSESVRKTAEDDRLTYCTFATEMDDNFDQQSLDELRQKTGIKVRIMPRFNSITNHLGFYQDLFAAKSSQPDICAVDSVWPSTLAEHFIDLGPYVENARADFDPVFLESCIIHGRLVAVPVFLDSGLLYCRTDLLREYGFPAPPDTWGELEHMAQVIQRGERKKGKSDFWGYAWQGAVSEALTCNAYEWQMSEGGGMMVDADGRPDVRNERFRYALERAVGWVGTISPPAVVEYIEDDGQDLFVSGKTAFLRNWVFGYAIDSRADSRIRDHFGVALMPSGRVTRARTLGGPALAVSKYSRYRNQAVAAALYLTSETVQRNRAVATGAIPTRPALYQKAELLSQTPLAAPLSKHVLDGLVARPSRAAGEHYGAVSRAYAQSIHSALTRQQTSEAALAQLDKDLAKILQRKS